MEINGKKDKLQQQWAKLFIESETKRHTEVLATGVGKSRLAMLIMEALNSEFDDFLILVDSTRLRDFGWKDDFKKWGKEDLFAKTKLNTYQTVHRWDPKTTNLSKTLVIADEIDFAIGTPKYGNFFRNFTDIKILGLTGYVTEDKQEELNTLLPVLVEYSFDQAVKDGVLNPTKYVFVKYDLDKDKHGITVKYKKDGQMTSFTQSENAAYDYADKQFVKAYAKFSAALVQKSMGLMDEKEFEKIEGIMRAKRHNRVKLLYTSIASRRVTKQLMDVIVKKNDVNKVVVFSKYTNQSDTLTKHTYHGKNSEEVNNKNYDDFNAGIIRKLGICDKINRGINAVGLNNIILESYSGSDTIFVQRRGRGARLDINEETTFYVLLPYYMKKVENGYEQAETQAVTWAHNMFKGYDISKATVIDVRTIKRL